MKITTRELVYTAFFTALITVGAFIKIDIPLPLYTMHFTLQWLFVLLAGLLLGKKLGAISVITYILIGLMGVPVFAAGGGLSYVLRPGFGFLLGFVLAAYVMGFVSEKMNSTTFVQLLIPASVGLILYYFIGAVYFYIIKNLYVGEMVSFSLIVVQYCLITVIPDFILCILAASFSAQLKPVINKYFDLKIVR